MSLSRSPGYIPTEISPLLRFFDEFNNHMTTHDTTGHQRALRTFRRNFDIYETKDTYELVGEVPGVEQKDISIEFTDSTTLVVKGHVERQYGPGSQQQGRITGDVSDQQQSHKATVEDEGQDSGKQQQQEQSQENQQVTKQQSDQGQGNHQHKSKFWVAERSVGDFYRYFEFPAPVDQDGVKASLKNGILYITVPKTKPQQPKKINIES